MMIKYKSIEDFYGSNHRRRTSGEADYGVHWRYQGANWPAWRVSYVQATGEVYAKEAEGRCSPVCHKPFGGKVFVLGIVPPDEVEDHGTYYKTLDEVLKGWDKVCGSDEGIEWVRDRIAAIAGPMRCDCCNRVISILHDACDGYMAMCQDCKDCCEKWWNLETGHIQCGL